MNPLYLIAVIVISLLYVWTLYNIPIVVAGLRNLCSGKRKIKNFLVQKHVHKKDGNEEKINKKL